MRILSTSLIFFALTPLCLRAQQEASTLEELCREAPYVATARLTAIETSKTQILARFSVGSWHKGERKGELVFTETTRTHCGSALHGLKKDQDYLLFFETTGTQLRILGGARGIVVRTEARWSAVKALLVIRNPAARARLLAGQLASSDARIRQDAALALADLPGLETSSKETRNLLLTHLDQEIQRTNSSALCSLLLANSRVDAHKTARRAWKLAIDAEHDQQSGLGRTVLLRNIGTKIMLSQVPLTSATTHGSRLLLLKALEETRSPGAMPWAEKLLLHKDLILQREATVTLLALGSTPRSLARRVGKELVKQAESLRAARLHKPRLRAIRPR